MKRIFSDKRIELVGNYHPFLDSLLQDYEEEFSAITTKEKGDDGRYALDVDLNSTEVHSFLLFVGELAIGFCIKNIDKQSGRHNIADFYIQEAYRRQGLGYQLAEHVFDTYSGEWQVMQLKTAGIAQDFWINTIDIYTNSNFSDEPFIDGYWGEVCMQTFYSNTSDREI